MSRPPLSLSLYSSILPDSPEAILAADPSIRGITRPAVPKLKGKWAYKTADHAKGECYTIKRRVYLHLFLNVQKRADEENNLGRSALFLKHDLEQGRLNELNDSAKRQATELFTVGRKSRNGTYSVTFNEEAYHEKLKRCGVFMLMISSAALSTEEAMLTYRKRTVLRPSPGAKDAAVTLPAKGYGTVTRQGAACSCR